MPNLLKSELREPASIKSFKKLFAGGPQAPKPLKNDLREARKQQNL